MKLRIIIHLLCVCVCIERDNIHTSFEYPLFCFLSRSNQTLTKMRSPESSSLSSPTAAELISQLRSSFFPHEFDSVAKTLTDREQRMKHRYLNLKAKAKEEKDQLSDELEKKQSEIDAVCLELKMVNEARLCENQELRNKQVEIDVMMKRIADYERKVRVLSPEKVGKESMGSSVHLESLELKDCAAGIHFI